MHRKTVLFLLVLSFHCLHAQITLTHNIGNTPIKTSKTSCGEQEYWARTFTLAEFGISTDEQFIINSGQVAVSNTYDGARMQFGVFRIDGGFPSSKPIYIGGSSVLTPEIGDAPQIIQQEFDQPIVIPAGVEKILVVVSQSEDIYNPNFKHAIIAGTEEDNDISWFKGCREYYTYTPTENLSKPVPDANFFINVTGEKFSSYSYGATTTLTHNVCEDLVEEFDFGCSNGGVRWARTFTVGDFGISNNEEFIINSGQIAFYEVGSAGADISFNIYEIDSDFPDSFSDANLIGSSQNVRLYRTLKPAIVEIQFDEPVTVPANVNRILVEVKQRGGGSAVFPAGTVQDNGLSWFKADSGGCSPQEYTSTIDMGKSDARFFINVTGNVNHVTNKFEMNISNICSEFLKEFSVEKKSDIASIVWNFGDPASGSNNTSTDISPFHDFSKDGKFTITATVTGKDGRVEVLTEPLDIKDPPKAYGISNIEACEDIYGTGIFSSFDISDIHAKVTGGQPNTMVTYVDGRGIEFDILPNPFTNTIRDRETITVRVSRDDELCCYSEISFDLIVKPLPDLSSIEDIVVCAQDNNGFASFDLSQIRDDLSNGTNLVEFFYQDGQQIPNSELAAVKNRVPDQEMITVKVFEPATDCSNETTFNIITSPLPIANEPQDIIGCDDNGDGISEYFDTTNVEAEVLNGQTGMEVSYFSESGVQLSSPLPNPLTNTKVNQERLRIRVTNTNTNCYAESFLNLKTSSKPQVNLLSPLYACDEGGGFGKFDTSSLTEKLIGNQPNLQVYYSDENGNSLPSPLPANYQNTVAWSQTIQVRVENKSNPLCYSETSVDLMVKELPELNLEEDYFLCDLEPSLYVSTDVSFDAWEWSFEDGTVVSNTFEANLKDAGTYTLWVYAINDEVACETTYTFNMVRSILPEIVEVKTKDNSDNNSIEIISSGDGDFEYSIDGSNFQNDNIFYNLTGGIYTAEVRDKNGCGSDTMEVVLVDYPKFFTPNGDGYNDTWQVRGISSQPLSTIHIFDKFGKLLTQLDASDEEGWDGVYNGKELPSADYWYSAQLEDGRVHTGHFSLIRR